MASSGSMDDSFKARVDKIFGSLAFSRSSSSTSSSPLQQSVLWSLTDDDVERKEWRRDKDSSHDRDEIPCSSSFDELLKKQRNSRNSRKKFDDDREDLDDDDGEDVDDHLPRIREDDGDEWQIRSSIGLDRTLDNEEEEDEYDKVALCRESAGERLYMSDVTDQGSYLNFHSALSNSLRRATRDPRANHMATEVRLKEDETEAEGEAQKFSSSHNSGSEAKELHAESSRDCGHLRSILKRKDNNADSRPRKRVRFDVSCENDGEEASEKLGYVSMGASSVNPMVSDGGSLPAKNASQVPDYLLNPSKYTRYSFDSSSETDEKSNTQACMDFLKLVKVSKPTESGSKLEATSVDVPKSVTFIPKKKGREVEAEDNSGQVKENYEDKIRDSLHRAVLMAMGIAAGEAHHCEVDATEDDKSEMNPANTSVGFQKPGRQYRTKSRSDDSDS